MFESILMWLFKWSLIAFIACLALLGIVRGIIWILERKAGDPSPSDAAVGTLNTADTTCADAAAIAGKNEEEFQWDKEDLERFREAFVCPECGETYDGVYCEICGYHNDYSWDDERSETDKWIDSMIENTD